MSDIYRVFSEPRPGDIVHFSYRLFSILVVDVTNTHVLVRCKWSISNEYDWTVHTREAFNNLFCLDYSESEKESLSYVQNLKIPSYIFWPLLEDDFLSVQDYRHFVE